MRVLEMECDGCGRLVRTAKDGDACGPCDIALCSGCLAGTKRCPSCQRLFAESRDLRPVVQEAPQEPRYLRVALLALLVIALGFAYVSFAGSGSEGRAERGMRGVGQVTGRVGGREAPRSLDDVLSAGRPREATPPLTDIPCLLSTTEQRRVLENVARLRFAPTTADDLAFGLRPVLSALDAEVRVSEGARGVPFSAPLRGVGRKAFHLVLFVDAWTDPALVDGAVQGGSIEGRLYAWDRTEGQMVCGTPVRHAIGAMDPPTEGDAIGSGRTELVIGAFRTGLDQLRLAERGGLGVRGR